MTKLNMLLFISLTSLAAACGKDGGGGAAKATELPDLPGVVIDVPGGSDLSDLSMGGPKNTMIRTDSYVVSVGLTGDSSEKTIEEVVENSKMYSAKVTKQDKTADGWHVEYNNKGDMGENFFLDIRRTINGTAYKCSTTQPQASQRDAAAKACMTLRAK